MGFMITMREALILITVLPGFEKNVWIELLNSLKNQVIKNHPISKVDFLLGEYDVVVHIDAKNEDEFLDTLLDIVRIKGVSNTSTLSILSNEYIKKKFG